MLFFFSKHSTLKHTPMSEKKECCKTDEPCCKDEEVTPEVTPEEKPAEKIVLVEKLLIKGFNYIVRLKSDPNCQRMLLKRVTDKCYQFKLQNGDEWWQTHEVFHNNFDVIEKFKKWL